MSNDSSSELASFHRFIGEQLHLGEIDLSPEEALDLWRMQNPDAQEYADTVEAVREALGDMHAGDRGTPIDEFDVEFRRRHGLPPRQ